MSISGDLNPLLMLLALSVCYAVLLAWIILKRGLRNVTDRALISYLCASAVWSAAFVLGRIAPLNSPLEFVGKRVAMGGLVVMAVLLLNLTHALLRQSDRFTAVWWFLGIVSMVVVVLMILDLLPWQIPTLYVKGYAIRQNDLAQLFSIAIWAGFTIAAILVTWRVYRETVSPVHRNRYRYLLLAIAMLVVADTFFATNLSPLDLFAVAVRWVSALVLTLAALRPKLADIKSVYRRAFSYMAVTLLTVGVAWGVIWLSVTLMSSEWMYGVLIGVGITAVFVTFASYPVRQAVQRFVDRRLFHIETDYETALRAYGEKVIGTLEMEQLADLVLDTLISTTGAHRAGLYLVREGKRDIGGMLLDPIKRVGELPAGDFELHPESTLASRLKRSDEPIAQYEIDLLPEFATLAPDECNWLRALAVELLIPIHTQDKLVGLIALGAKGSGEAYSTSEIEWLKSLADQTAVALENARLFDQVRKMSVDVMRLHEDLKRAYERLQEVDRLKSAFIGMISHELRSPFVAASFSVQLLYRYAEKGMMKELREQIKQLDQELVEGRRMIDSVISFASLLSKQGQMNLEQADMSSLIRATVAPLSKMAHSRNISVSLRLSSKLPKVSVDKSRMSEAIYHLVHNAIKFNHEGGSVRISCWATDTYVVFKVEDTGRGIPRDKLDTIWEAFTQAADDVKRGVEGPGLGLALVKSVVEAHGGEVWVTSKVGVGSTFGFRIPIKREVNVTGAEGGAGDEAVREAI